MKYKKYMPNSVKTIYLLIIYPGGLLPVGLIDLMVLTFRFQMMALTVLW